MSVLFQSSRLGSDGDEDIYGLVLNVRPFYDCFLALIVRQLHMIIYAGVCLFFPFTRFVELTFARCRSWSCPNSTMKKCSRASCVIASLISCSSSLLYENSTHGMIASFHHTSSFSAKSVLPLSQAKNDSDSFSSIL